MRRDLYGRAHKALRASMADTLVAMLEGMRKTPPAVFEAAYALAS